MKPQLRVLFIGTSNEATTQMAEAMLRHLSGGRVEAQSAGITPGASISETARALMAERGISMAGQKPKGLDTVDIGSFDVLVGVGNGTLTAVSGETLPRERLHWTFPDPVQSGLQESREIRDIIELRLEALLSAWKITEAGRIVRVKASGLSIFYGDTVAIKKVDLEIEANKATALIGPSGCGKSTFLRALNRMNELIPSCRTEGQVLLDGQDIYAPNIDLVALRRRVGMIFQKSNPFPKSVFENVAYGLKVGGVSDKNRISEVVEQSLRQAAIWDEVKDLLNRNALSFSGGQQQRLCIARALAVQPEVILMDEPASALDPISTSKIEELIFELKKNYTIVIVTHNMQQAARVSDYTGFFLLGELVEFGITHDIFTKPKDKRTEAYITGRFG
jgi:phosphate transport system ATP-binding protein